MEKETLDRLLNTENAQLEKLNRIVVEAIEEQKLLANKLMEFEDTNLPLSSRVSDRVASFGGSWTFIILFLLFIVAWIGINVGLTGKPFDPFPFILLNLMLSTIAALQAPLIMMSQNRKEGKDRQRAINDYLINLKAELEIRNIHAKLDLLIAEQMRTLFEIQKEQMAIMEEIKAVIEAR